MESSDTNSSKTEFSDVALKNPRDDGSELEKLLRLLSSKNENKVAVACEIAKFGDEAIERLVQILKQGDENAREGAIIALGEIGKRRVEALKALLPDEDEKVRAGIALALGLVGGECVKPVIGLLKDRSAIVRVAAVKALSISGSFELLIQALKSGDWRIKYGVFIALEEAGGKAVKPLLKAVMKEDERQKELIRSILLKIARRYPESFRDVVMDTGDLRIPAMEILIELGDTAFLSTLMSSRERRVREATIIMISFVDDPKLKKIVIKALEDESWFVRLVAAETIVKKYKRGIKHLRKFIDGEKTEIVKKSIKEIVEDMNF